MVSTTRFIQLKFRFPSNALSLMIHSNNRHFASMPAALIVCIAFAVVAVFVGMLSRYVLVATVTVDRPGFVDIYFSKASAAVPDERLSVQRYIANSSSRKIEVIIPGNELGMLHVVAPEGATTITVCDVSGGRRWGELAQLNLGTERGAARESEVGRCLSSASHDGSRLAVDGHVDAHVAKAAAKSSRRLRITAWLSLLISAISLSRLLLRYGSQWRSLENWRYAKAHVVFLLLSIPFGVGYLVLTPPGGVPDELAHVTKAVAVSHGALIGAPVDNRIDDIRASFGPFDANWFNRSLRFEWAQVASTFQVPLACVETNARNVATSAYGYAPIPYLISALAYRASCAVGATFGWMYYSAELMTLAIAIYLTFLGIRFAGEFGWGITAVALLPMTVFLSASFSSDSITLALSFLLIGLVVGIATGATVARHRVLLLLCAVSLSLALTKPGYAWLVGIALVALPAVRHEKAKMFFLIVGCVLVPCVVHGAFVLSVAEYAMPRTGVDPAANWRALIERPFQIFPLYYHTFLSANGLYLYQSMLGRLDWRDATLGDDTTWVATLGFIGAIFAGQANRTLRFVSVARLYGISLALAGGIVLSLPLYLSWTTLGWPFIQGIQGRYLLVVAALLLVSMSAFRLRGFRAPWMFILFGCAFYNLVSGGLYLLDRYHGYP